MRLDYQYTLNDTVIDIVRSLFIRDLSIIFGSLHLLEHISYIINCSIKTLYNICTYSSCLIAYTDQNWNMVFILVKQPNTRNLIVLSEQIAQAD